MNRNPFHVLQLPTDATAETIVRRAAEAAELAETDAERHAVIEARRELITHPAVRLGHELLEVPDSDYRDQDWEAFEHQHKRDPVDFTALAAGAEPLRPADFTLAAVLGMAADEAVVPPEPDLPAALADPPVRPAWDTPPLEVRHVLFG
ncbi:hypothetical protein [Kutzneria sp. CA-103260]|uniref:hypothetical protein n=1 Tax=Kutzneria sp. CA-103260 TaxID=2802641 RepID=UPI001BA86C82|nr:hypothetical protein [Kutzneria sp. CA-103260]QUQ67111.1 hypothetical protein JJ691_48430 [Kutzneria sp. CA-103260]